MRFLVGTGSAVVTGDVGNILWNGTWHLITGVYDGSEVAIYVDGKFNNSVAAAGASISSASTQPLTFGVSSQLDFTNTYLTGVKVRGILIHSRRLKDSEIRQLYVDPYCLFSCDETAARVPGGSTFTDTATDSLAAAETEGATAIFAAAQAEALTASESVNATATFPVARTETLAASDAVSGSATFAGGRTETLTAGDACDCTVIYAGAVAESLTVADARSASATFLVASSDSLAATDSETGSVTTITTVLYARKGQSVMAENSSAFATSKPFSTRSTAKPV